MTRAASIARQAADAGLKATAKFFVTPGTEQIRATLARDGVLKDFERMCRLYSIFQNAVS
jgi:aconitate hydratase